MLPFSPAAVEEEISGGLLIVKMDIEGAEFQILKMEANRGTLCKYAAMGNKVVLIVEFHEFAIADTDERARETEGVKDAKKKLEDCGVEFANLDPNWI